MQEQKGLKGLAVAKQCCAVFRVRLGGGNEEEVTQLSGVHLRVRHAHLLCSHACYLAAHSLTLDVGDRYSSELKALSMNDWRAWESCSFKRGT